MSGHGPEAVGEWSPAVDALRARFRVRAEPVNGAMRHGVVLEVENRRARSVALGDPPRVRLEVRDHADSVLAPSPSAAGAPAPQPARREVAPGAMLSLRIDDTGVGVPGGERGVALLAAGGRCWWLTPGDYRLRMQVSFDSGGDRWAGVLHPPPLSFTVAARE